MQIKESICCVASSWCFVDQCFGCGVQRQGQSQHEVMPCFPARTHSLLSGSNPELIDPVQVSSAHPLLQPRCQWGKCVNIFSLLARLEQGQGLKAWGQGLYLMNVKHRRVWGGGWPVRAEYGCLAVEDLPKNQQDLINNLLWMYNWHYHSAPCVHAELICVGMLQPGSRCGTAVPEWNWDFFFFFFKSAP